MEFSLRSTTPQHPHPLLERGSTRLCSSQFRAPPVRRNASRKLMAMADTHRHAGVKKEGPNLGRRALLMVGLVGSNLLRLKEAAAQDVNADVYHSISFARERSGKRREYNQTKVGGTSTQTLTRDEGSQDGGIIDEPATITDKLDSGETIRQDTEAVKSNEEVQLLNQNAPDINQEMPSATENSIEINKDSNQKLPSFTQNPIDANQDIQNPLKEDQQEVTFVNTSFSILNTVGIIGSGVLGALYANSQKDKAEIQSIVDKMKSQLEEKDVAKKLLEKNFQNNMLTEQEERRKQIRKLREEEAAIRNQLASANATISALVRELQSEKNAVKDVNLQLDRLRASHAQVQEEKRDLEGKLKEQEDETNALQDRVSLLDSNLKGKNKSIEELNTFLSDKTSECQKLKTLLDQTRADYESSCSSLEILREEVAKANKEVASKNSVIDELNGRIKSVLSERDTARKEIVALEQQYSNLKMVSATKAEADSVLLSEKDNQLQQLQEKLHVTMKEVEERQDLTVALSNEKDGYEAALVQELENVKKLQLELRTMQASFETSKREVSELSKLLKGSRDQCEDLRLDLAKVQNESSKSQESLLSSLNEARADSVKLSDELATTKANLNIAMQELIKLTNELEATCKACESLKAEVLGSQQKIEAVTSELHKERDVVAKLNDELGGSRDRIQELLEARKTLESYLGKASQSLDEMNNNALSLSRELDNAQSANGRLGKENEMLHDSLIEQRNATKQALENIEDAQNVILRLGAERESLVSKIKKLEEELATAKGEILLQRKHINARDASLNESHTRANGVEASASPVTARRPGGRRKRGGTT